MTEHQKTYRVTLIPGDGIGPEVTGAARRVLEATSVKFDWELRDVGQRALDQEGSLLPESVLESIKRNRVAFKGPVTTPIGSGFRSVNVALRKELDLYACVRPCKTYPGVPSSFQDVDIVVIRENTEDLYAGIEFEKGAADTASVMECVARFRKGAARADAGISLKIISEGGSRRIVRYAFDYARQHGRQKVTALHKSNIMKFSDGLFLAVARQVAKEYPDIEFEDRLIDNAAMQLVKAPQQFDVLVAPNLYGDIVSDLCAGLVGGLGLAPGANVGERGAVFEPTHGSAPKYTGLNKVNPMAMLLSGMLMLRYLGEAEAADRLERAVAAVIAEGKSVTYDMKTASSTTPPLGTSQVADAVIEKLRE